MQLKEREKVLERIKEYERLGLWNNDVEDDMPAKPLKSKKVDYLNEKLSSKILSAISNKIALYW